MDSQNIELIKRMYGSMYRIRRVEEEIAEIYSSDKIKSPIHLSIGQEAVAVGVCEALRKTDYICQSCRGHATYLAKGGNLKAMIAELYGKVTGCAKGKGGSMHLVDGFSGVIGTSAIMGSNIPIAVGYALAQKYKGNDTVTVVFFGDGAIDEGAFHESINFAALKKLPILFVCENNEWAIHSHHLKRHNSDNLYERAQTYGVPACRIEKNDIFEIYHFAKTTVEDLRKIDKGPAFVEIMTSRWKEHVGPDDDFKLGYRSYSNIADWVENDQLKRLGNLIKFEDKKNIENEVKREIQEAFDFAEDSPFPEIEELNTDLFCGGK